MQDVKSPWKAGVSQVRADERPSVLVYRRRFLPWSETFVADHLRHLTSWRGVAACEARVCGGLDVDDLQPAAIHAGMGRLQRLRSDLVGVNPHLDGIVARQGVRLIHAHFLTDGARLSAYARRSRLPLVVTAHGFDATIHALNHLRNADGRLYLLARRRLIGAATMIVCVSDFIRHVLEDAGFPASKLTTIRLGVDTMHLTAHPGTPRQGVLFVGRMVEKKGLHYLLQAWTMLPEALQATPLDIAGDGPLRASYEAMAQSLGVAANFLGARPRAEVLERMARCQAFVLPSARARNGDSEGLPVVLMEAQALGAPAIIFDEGPSPEAVCDGRTGLLAHARDPASLARAIETVLTDAALARELGRQGPLWVQQRYDLARNVAALESLYDSLAIDRGLT